MVIVTADRIVCYRDGTGWLLLFLSRYCHLVLLQNTQPPDRVASWVKKSWPCSMSGLLCTWQLSCVRIEKRSKWVMYSCGFTVAAACSTLLTTSLAGWLTQSRVSAGFSPAENHFFDTWQLLKPEDFQVIHGGSEKGDTNSVLLYIFSSYWQILKVLSLSHSLGNLQQSNQQRFHHPSVTSLHYLVKC